MFTFCNHKTCQIFVYFAGKIRRFLRSKRLCHNSHWTMATRSYAPRPRLRSFKMRRNGPSLQIPCCNLAWLYVQNSYVLLQYWKSFRKTAIIRLRSLLERSIKLLLALHRREFEYACWSTTDVSWHWLQVAGNCKSTSSILSHLYLLVLCLLLIWRFLVDWLICYKIT